MKPLLASLLEILEPGIIGAGANAFPSAQVSDRSAPPKPF